MPASLSSEDLFSNVCSSWASNRTSRLSFFHWLNRGINLFFVGFVISLFPRCATLRNSKENGGIRLIRSIWWAVVTGSSLPFRVKQTRGHSVPETASCLDSRQSVPVDQYTCTKKNKWVGSLLFRSRPNRTSVHAPTHHANNPQNYANSARRIYLSPWGPMICQKPIFPGEVCKNTNLNVMSYTK